MSMLLLMLSRIQLSLKNQFLIIWIGKFWHLGHISKEIFVQCLSMFLELLFISIPASRHIYLKGVRPSCQLIEIINLIQLMLREILRIWNLDRHAKIVSVVVVSWVPVVGHYLSLSRSNPEVFSHHLFPELGIQCPKQRELGFELFVAQSEAFVNVVESHLEVEHEVPMVVSEEKAVVLAASRMVGDQFIMKASGGNLVVIILLVSWVCHRIEVSLFHFFKGGKDPEHFQAPEVLLSLILRQALNILPDSNFWFH